MTLTNSLQSRLEHQHETVQELIQGLTLFQLQQRVYPEKWSVFENIVHLAAYQPTFIERLDKILEGNKPSFNRYVAEQDPRFHEYMMKSLEELLKDLNFQRQRIVERLSRLDARSLSLVAHHGKFGWMPITGWTEFFLLHESHHLYTIFQLVGTFRLAQQ
ncbi:MAG TPA: DinB family protein [Puia sp.]|nr:DinB family protein [Puia sp.]